MRYFISGLFGIVVCGMWMTALLLAFAGIGAIWVCGKITNDDDMLDDSIYLFGRLHNALLEIRED